MRKVLGKRTFFKPALICCAQVLWSSVCGHALASESALPFGSGGAIVQSKVPWTIHADKLEFDQAEHAYKARGHVRLTSTDRSIEADYATINNHTRVADLHGNVTVQYGRNWLKGQHIVWNLDTETGTMDRGVIFFAENNFFVQGSSISKTGPSEFELAQGFITSCNPSDPQWKIQFNKMTVKVGGQGEVTDTSFWAKDYQLFYWPFMNLPVNTQRQSGFLLPFAGDSTLNGIHLEVPYYWAIRDDMDATFYTDYMQTRGVMGGLEYRINNTTFGQGIWQFNYLQDQASRSFLASEGYPYQTSDRYWLRGMQDITLPGGIDAKIDLDYVSDPNFLQEFAIGSSSYFSSTQEFQSAFNRGILYDQNALVRESDIYLEKAGESDLLSLDTRYWENMQTTTLGQTTEKLPSLYYSIIPSPIDNTPFYYSLDSSEVNYWSQGGDDQERLDVRPQIFAPFQWQNYLNIEPSVGMRGDAYSIQWDQSDSGNNNLVGREEPDVNIDMSSRLNRVYPVNVLGYTAVQNAIEPEISYEYATQTLTSAIPQLDYTDLNQARNGIRYGFTTFLTGKQLSPGDSDSDSPTVTYTEIARLRVFQFFNIEQPDQIDSLFDTDTEMPEGFSPLGVRLDLMPIQSWTFSYDLDWNFRSGEHVEAQDFTGSYTGSPGNLLMVDYEEIPDLDVNEITLITYFKIYRNIYLSTYHDYSFQGNLWFTQGYGIRYVKGCWGFGVGYEQVGIDNRFLFTLDLSGIGSLGNQVSFFGLPQFGESFPGYQHPETWLLNQKPVFF